jgi:transporter family protein
MDKWVLYASASMVFAGFTSVIAKLAIRTCFVFVFVLMFAGAVVPAGHLQAVTLRNVL